MKPICALLLAASILLFFGCAQEKPEAAAKKIFEQQVAGHEGLQLDTSGLDYELVEQDGDRALVEVTGLMPVKAKVPLVKKQGKWVMAAPAEEVESETSSGH